MPETSKPKYYFMFAHHKPKCAEHDDVHLVKVHEVFPDGRVVRRVLTIYNFLRPFWITKPIYRKHKDKKEFEDLKKVKEYRSTESDLINNAARALGRDGYRRNNKRDIENNPYLYGLDVRSTVYLKKAFMAKVNNEITTYTTAGLDTETNPDTDEILMTTVAMDTTVRTYVTKAFIKDIKDPERKILDLAKKHLPQEIFDKLDYKVFIVDNELESVKQAINKLHEWKPDFLMIWNVLFDIGVIKKVCDKYNYPMRILFKDPDIPDSHAIFKIKEGQTVKRMASGKETPVPVQQRWNVVTTSSSFYIIDGMTAYNYVRQGEKFVPGGYGLDNLLKRVLKRGKLKIIETSRIGKDWHTFMQENHPLEYIVYNAWDTQGMIEFNKVTKDLSISLPVLAGPSDFDYFNSGPKKNVDGITFYALEELDRVLMTRGNKDIVAELSLGKDDASGRGWITTLEPSKLTTKNADITVIEENGV
jgi:hypothetical protein